AARIYQGSSRQGTTLGAHGGAAHDETLRPAARGGRNGGVSGQRRVKFHDRKCRNGRRRLDRLLEIVSRTGPQPTHYPCRFGVEAREKCVGSKRQRRDAVTVRCGSSQKSCENREQWPAPALHSCPSVGGRAF